MPTLRTRPAGLWHQGPIRPYIPGMGTDTTNIYPEFSPGQKVRTCYGETRTVLFQNGCQVFVEEECNGWYHPTKVWAVPLVNNQPNISDLITS